MGGATCARGMRRSSCVAVLVLLPFATTTALPLHPDHQTDSTPHHLLPPRLRKGYSTFRVRPRILKESDKKLLEKTKRILSSLGSYLKMELTNVDHKMKMEAVSRARKLQAEAQQRALMRMNGGRIRKERKTVGWESARKLQVLAREREKKIKDQAKERARRLLKERRASFILSPGSRAGVTGFGLFA